MSGEQRAMNFGGKIARSSVLIVYRHLIVRCAESRVDDLLS